MEKHHTRAAFKSGVSELDRYLIHQASQDIKRYLARIYVATRREETDVVGFYTLSASRIDIGELPIEVSQKLPSYPYVPAILIGRLAVDLSYQGKGLGKLLLMDALYKSFKDHVAAMAVIVEAKNDNAKAFYQTYDFEVFPEQPRKLFVRMAKIKLLFQDS